MIVSNTYTILFGKLDPYFDRKCGYDDSYNLCMSSECGDGFGDVYGSSDNGTGHGHGSGYGFTNLRGGGQGDQNRIWRVGH